MGPSMCESIVKYVRSFGYEMFEKTLCLVQCAKKATLSRDARFFLIFLFVRLSSVFLVQTWFVPDEYWQSMEVAHSMVFGYGHRTWEWVLGLRSYLHPLPIAALYKALHLIDMDSVTLLVLGPRVCQAVLSAYADLKFYQWSGNHKWAAFNIATSWFWFYTGSRTLVNSLETCLSTVALSQFPWPGREVHGAGGGFLWTVALACAARPTAAVMWTPLCAYHLWMSARMRSLRRTLLRYAAVGAATLAGAVALDSLCYGRPVVTQWQFLRLNVLGDAGTLYGSQPWHWYLSAGLPAVLGVQLLPFALAVAQTFRRGERCATQLVLVGTVAWTVAVFSCLAHKEFRFLLPLLPVALHLSSRLIARWSRKAGRGRLWAVAAALLLGNALPAAYLGTVHQRGTLDVMGPLGELAAARPNDTSFLFLMPCHSTPLYSHVHVPVPMRFLTCEPPLVADVDEADLFYENPNGWLRAQYPPNGTLPSHIVTFDTLVPRLASILTRYKTARTFEHTAVSLTGRVGSHVVLHQHIDY